MSTHYINLKKTLLNSKTSSATDISISMFIFNKFILMSLKTILNCNNVMKRQFKTNKFMLTYNASKKRIFSQIEFITHYFCKMDVPDICRPASHG